MKLGTQVFENITLFVVFYYSRITITTLVIDNILLDYNSIVLQLKDVAGKVPQDSSLSIKPNLLDETTSNPLSPSTWNHLPGKTFLEPYSDSQILGPIFLYGSSGESEKLDGDTECKSCP